MRRRRFPDWLLYLGALVALVWFTRAWREEDDVPPPQPAPGVEAGPALPAPGAAETPEGRRLRSRSPFDPQVMVEAPTRPADGVGTAFAIDDAGVWYTARHVVEGCTRVGVVAGRGRVIRATWDLHPAADLAVLNTDGGPEPLPVAPDFALYEGQRAYHPGFPQGEPGEVTTRLIGRETLVVTGGDRRSEPVLAWAESGRSRNLRGSLGGLSGAPALDNQGRVIGVTIAEAPRRGRVYTTAPETFTQLLSVSPPDSTAPMTTVSPENYGRIADTLRRERRVAQVICLAE